MSVYNGERFLAEAIESILAQSMPDFEFLILNDGSTDNSKAIIDGYTGKDGRIRPIHRENKGLIASLNQLVEEASTPLIARMDADDISVPTRFEKQLNFLSVHPDHGVLGSWCADIDEQGHRIFLNIGDQPITHEEIVETIQDRSCLCHPSVMMSRNLVQSVGGYHAAFKHCEDYDLWLRLLPKTKMANLPERLINYRISPGQITQQNTVLVTYGAIIARLAYARRLAGQSDPTEDLRDLPECETLDILFDQPGLSHDVYDELFRHIAHSKGAMRSDIFQKFISHIHEGGNKAGHWRTVARLAVRMNEPARAMQLASAMVTS